MALDVATVEKNNLMGAYRSPDGHIELTDDATRGVCEVGKDLHEPKTRDA
ncbi:hypothetical protein PMI37_01213 [Pseudomonas sp. GM80]|nr:hypothetical protein PMI37_01213 [Pseudomonas sp. GM80]